MDKQLGRLGLAKRAGRLAIGFDPALKAVKDGSAVLILLASDLSEKTLKEWRFAAERYAAGIPHRIADRHAHIGRAQLRQHCAVTEFHHGMHNALGMDEHMDLFRVGVKEPFSLDHLQRFIEHRGRIHSDLRAHRPVGMR